MDYSEHELMTIAKELDRSASFVLIKRQYYKNHKRIKKSILRFQEVVFIDRKDKHFLEFIIGVFPQEIKKIHTGFRLKYFSKEAVYLLWTLLPYLNKKKRLAELILKYAEIKSASKHKITQEEQEKRLAVYAELQAESARIRQLSKKPKENKQ